MNDLIGLEKISKYAGERYDLVQAGGGNTSVKHPDGRMNIKASGFSLSDVTEHIGHVVVDNIFIREFLTSTDFSGLSKKELEDAGNKILKDSVLTGGNFRPSIETFLHSMLMKFTLHTHSIIVNILAVRNDFEDIIKKIFADKYPVVSYMTPGLELALGLIDKYTNQKVIFLKNHGVIVTSDTAEEVISIHEDILHSIEKYLHINNDSYRNCNLISEEINFISQNRKICVISENYKIKDFFKNNVDFVFNKPICPDVLIYCGYKPLHIKKTLKYDISEHFKEYNSIPEIIIYSNNVYIIANNIKKAKEIEDVFSFYIQVLESNNDLIDTLPDSEIGYLLNWEAEKWRQKV